jgi:hypothetical protein
MIVQIAGTSGAGKSHLVRQFMCLGEVHPVLSPKQNRVIGYNVDVPEFPTVHIAGSYETPTGGCDTIQGPAAAYNYVMERHEEGVPVLFEGLYVMHQTRGPSLAKSLGRDFVVILLTTPLATCLASINLRRAERGSERLPPRNETEQNYIRARNYTARMRDAGARVHRVPREKALDTLLTALRSANIPARM